MTSRRRNDERGIATGIIVGAVAAVVLGGTTVAYVATDGFGTRSDDTENTSTSLAQSASPSEGESPSESAEASEEPSPTGTDTPAGTQSSPTDQSTEGPRDGMTSDAIPGDTVPGERPEDAARNLAPTDALSNGQFVECTYTHEGYDTKVTLRAMNDFRIDQDTQGGRAHVVRGPQTTWVWIDGMQEAYKYSTSRYEAIARDQMYPMFAPGDFFGDSAPEDTCTTKMSVDEGIFRLPGGLPATPGPNS